MKLRDMRKREKIFERIKGCEINFINENKLKFYGAFFFGTKHASSNRYGWHSFYRRLVVKFSLKKLSSATFLELDSNQKP